MPRRNLLLDRLRQGPLAADDFAGLATSRSSLRVRIHYLREKGFRIESHPASLEPSGKSGPTAVVYHLVGEPADG